MSITDQLDADLQDIELVAGRLHHIRAAWAGSQPAAFLSHSARESLDSRLSRLSVNFPRLAVSSLADRVRLTGFTRGPDPAGDLWRNFTAADGVNLAGLLTTDRLLYGASYVTVWTDGNTRAASPRLTLSGDTPFSMTVKTDPVTGEVLRATRRVNLTETKTAAVLYTPESVTRWERDGYGAEWKKAGETSNPLGVVPVVPLVRRGSLTDLPTGSSYVADILDLTDAVAKLLADSMVTSEYFARPRRWAVGLEIQEDEDGNVLDPFGASRFLQSEDPATKFGQLDAGRLDAYGDMIATLTQQIGSLTGLPPHYLGLHGDQPPSSEAVKASETQLTERARHEQSQMGRGWQDVAWLADAALAGQQALESERAEYAPSWESPETRTPAQAADAAAKLRLIGVPLESVLRDPLGYSPDDAAEIAAAGRLESVLLGAVNPAGRQL